MKRFKSFKVFPGGMLRRDFVLGPLVFSKAMLPVDDAGDQVTTYQVTLFLIPRRLSVQWIIARNRHR